MIIIGISEHPCQILWQTEHFGYALGFNGAAIAAQGMTDQMSSTVLILQSRKSSTLPLLQQSMYLSNCKTQSRNWFLPLDVTQMFP